MQNASLIERPAPLLACAQLAFLVALGGCGALVGWVASEIRVCIGQENKDDTFAPRALRISYLRVFLEFFLMALPTLFCLCDFCFALFACCHPISTGFREVPRLQSWGDVHHAVSVFHHDYPGVVHSERNSGKRVIDCLSQPFATHALCFHRLAAVEAEAVHFDLSCWRQCINVMGDERHGTHE